jgi:long-chain acyl-CoA synthetase
MLLNEIMPRMRGSAARVHFLSEAGDTRSYTFTELHDDVRVLAETLTQLGVVPGMRIGILGSSSYRWLVWDLAISSCGAISVAFAHEKSEHPLEDTLERLSVCLIAASPALLSPADVSLPEVVDIDVSAFPGKRIVTRWPSEARDPRTHSLAFSSGTTGKSKGLLISRPGTEHLLNLFAAAFGSQDGDRFLTFLPFANYQQRMLYYFCLYHGVDFVHVAYKGLFQGLKQFRPTCLIAPPVFYELLRSMTEAGVPFREGDPLRHERLSTRLHELLGGNVRYLITGMAPIKRQTLDFFWKQDVELYEAFGITEAGMVCWNKPGQIKLGSVGRPAEPRSVSLSADGEVIVTREALLSLGYFESTEEDARATFIGPNSVATGDIARLDDDGFLTIVGRKKDAIVLRSGEKFHPEATETLIQEDPHVKAAVVMGGEPLPEVVALVVVRDSRDGVITGQIHKRVAQINASLPQCQKVRQVLFTESEFTTENGMRTGNLKLNRRAILKRFEAELMPAGGAHVGR